MRIVIEGPKLILVNFDDILYVLEGKKSSYFTVDIV